MKFSRAFIRKAVRGDEVCAKAVYQVLRHCAGVACSKQKLLVYADDVANEMWFFLRDNYRRIDPDYNLEPFMIRVAEFVLKAHYRHFGMYGTGGLPGEDGDSGFAEDSRESALAEHQESSAPTIENESSMDTQRAIQDLLTRSASLRRDIRVEQEMLLSGVQPAAPRGAARRNFTITDEQKRMKDMRVAMKFTQRKMAFLLGIRLCTYQSYEYGRTLSVPPGIMEQMRDLFATSSKPEAAPVAPAPAKNARQPASRSLDMAGVAQSATGPADQPARAARRTALW